MSVNTFANVPLAVMVMRHFARNELPSTTAATIRAQCCVVSLFILTIMLERSRAIESRLFLLARLSKHNT